jgi:hypothetical protein
MGQNFDNILWYVDRCQETTAKEAAIKQLLLSNGFTKQSCLHWENYKQQGHGVICAVRQFRVDSWGNELVVRQLPVGKKMSSDAEDIVGIRLRATNDEDTADRKGLMFPVVICEV